MDEMESVQTTDEAPKKRKLKHPRVTRACLFCKKRKARCSGTLPCDTCVREEVQCDYGLGRAPSVAVVSPAAPSHIAESDSRESHSASRSSTTTSRQITSRRNSIDPPPTFVEGRHVDPTAGMSFLYHNWNRPDAIEGASKSHSETDDSLGSSASLMTYGDFRQTTIDANELAHVSLTSERLPALLEIYFRFATPTYRYMHQSTLEQWGKAYTQDGGRLTATQEACVLLVCAQSLLYGQSGDRYVTGGDEDIYMSRCLCEKAKVLLERETGSPSSASVQARLAMCLYLLSTFRMNECRFAFSFAATIITSLGLHRKQSTSSSKFSILEREIRRRAFWCAYVLDGYLSVMLGRPRSFRDEDIDQPYPQNISDADLVSTEAFDAADLPLHGNLEAFVAHVELAKLMGRNNDLLYPLYSLTEDLILERTNEMLDALDLWLGNLPGFLRPRNTTLTGQRTFERQNTVLKLAAAHLRILTTRRCLLTDFTRLGRTVAEQSHDSRATRPLQECFAAIKVVIDAVRSLVDTASLHQAYWFTQYIAIVAISTLYVFRVQGVSRRLAGYSEVHFDLEEYFRKAKDCQKYLSALAPDGSQAKRHYQLLERLRSKAETKKTQQKRYTSHPMEATGEVTLHTSGHATVPVRSHEMTQSPREVLTMQPALIQPMAVEGTFTAPEFPLAINSPVSGVGTSIFSSQFTPPSEADFEFAASLNLGWESLDTIGFLSNDGGYDFSMM